MEFVVSCDQFPHELAAVGQQHFFLVPADAAVADAKVFGDLSVTRPLQNTPEDFRASWRQFDVAQGAFHCFVHHVQHLDAVTRSKRFSCSGKMQIHRLTSNVQFPRYRF